MALRCGTISSLITGSDRRYVFLLIILWTRCLVSVAVTEHFAESGESCNTSCRLRIKTNSIKAFCSQLGLTSIPGDLPQNTTTLDASYNQIRVLRNDSFKNLQKLTSLSVKGNLISDIEVESFWPLTEIRTLNMAQNKLSHLHDNIFASNRLLSKLLFFSNNFSSIPTQALAMLPELHGIYFIDNSIQKADFSALSHSSKISVIELGNNEISSIKASDFIPLQNHSLNHLSLDSNKLHNLPERLFSYLKRVETLVLTFNRFQNFHWSSFLGNMTIGRLFIDGCRIRNIIRLDNASLSNTSIDSINMQRNIIAYIPPHTFWGFYETRKLILTQNKITTVFQDSFCGLDSLTHLDLSDNRIKSLKIDMFSCNPKLQELMLSNNELLRMNIRSFSGLSDLHTLDISKNYLKHVYDRQQWANPALQLLNFSYNQFTTLNTRLFSGVLSNLQIVDVSQNKIGDYSEFTFDNVPTLRELYLIKERKQRLNGVFSQMRNLVKLDISHGDTFWMSMNQFNGTRSLEELRMTYNALKNVDLFDNETQSSLFEGLVSLKRLNLKGNNLMSLDAGVFSPLVKLYSLDLSRSNIVHLKNGLFQGLATLKNLYLDENKIVTTSAASLTGLYNLQTLFFKNSSLQVLDKNLFLPLPHLRHLYLSGNQISEIKEETFFPTNHTLMIDISANRFTCNCKLGWFISWLQSSDIDLQRPDQTQCYNTSFNAVIGKPILTFAPADFCGVNILLITGMSFLGVVVSCLCIIGFNKRWWLNHKFFLLKLAVLGYEEMAEDFNEDNYEFHLNLMFQEEDEEWFVRFMKPALEERLPHLQKIVFGDGDLPLGMFYINAIYDVIENSFKTVLLLSNQSIRDAWFMTKLRLAAEHLNDTGLDKIILVFVEDIADDHLPYLVRLFLSRNKPYMLWTDDEDGQELFWAQFEKSMRANKAINNVIPL